MASLLARGPANEFGICCVEGETCGCVFYPAAAMVNHSCVPTTGVQVEAGCMFVIDPSRPPLQCAIGKTRKRRCELDHCYAVRAATLGRRSGDQAHKVNLEIDLNRHFCIRGKGLPCSIDAPLHPVRGLWM